MRGDSNGPTVAPTQNPREPISRPRRRRRTSAAGRGNLAIAMECSIIFIIYIFFTRPRVRVCARHVGRYGPFNYGRIDYDNIPSSSALYSVCAWDESCRYARRRRIRRCAPDLIVFVKYLNVFFDRSSAGGSSCRVSLIRNVMTNSALG